MYDFECSKVGHAQGQGKVKAKRRGSNQHVPIQGPILCKLHKTIVLLDTMFS